MFNNNGTWTAVKNLPWGEKITYKVSADPNLSLCTSPDTLLYSVQYVVDGNWQISHQAGEQHEDDGHNNVNNVFTGKPQAVGLG